MLRVARRLGELFKVRVHTCLLAAHALPPEFYGTPDAYIDVIAREWLPQLHAEGLVDSVDIFCESIGFSAEQAAILFQAAARLGTAAAHARRAALEHRRQPGRGALSCPVLRSPGICDTG